MSDTNRFSATRAGKIMHTFLYNTVHLPQYRSITVTILFKFAHRIIIIIHDIVIKNTINLT